ncbi:DUF6920 family protein [Salinimicrobium flavum]|uniref:DUF6920 family protein n=1 Tax=Salinimicrobium flavum TaxID=1737065 RepID=A0ABW5IZ20_9FLAO
MMKVVFGIILLLHGSIHLLGLIKAFRPQSIPQLTRNIQIPEGLLWLVAFLLLFAAAILYFLKKDGWEPVAIIGVILSQLLVTINWEEAKFGTLLNLLILAVALSAYGYSAFSAMTAKEVSVINSAPENSSSSSKNAMAALPASVQKWLKVTGATDHTAVTTAYLEQKGRMKINPNGRWMRFYARQHFTVYEPAFVWRARVKAFPLVYLDGRDKLVNGKGEMLIKLFSLIKVAEAKGNLETDTGTMLRFLGEICWFPTAALEPYISWKEIVPGEVKAVLAIKDQRVSGTFSFDRKGQLRSFEAFRYYGSGEKAKQEKWVIEITEHKDFDGMLVPSACKVTWKLPGGDFTWLELEITSLQYNS